MKAISDKERMDFLVEGMANVHFCYTGSDGSERRVRCAGSQVRPSIDLAIEAQRRRNP